MILTCQLCFTVPCKYTTLLVDNGGEAVSMWGQKHKGTLYFSTLRSGPKMATKNSLFNKIKRMTTLNLKYVTIRHKNTQEKIFTTLDQAKISQLNTKCLNYKRKNCQTELQNQNIQLFKRHLKKPDWKKVFTKYMPKERHVQNI